MKTLKVMFAMLVIASMGLVGCGEATEPGDGGTTPAVETAAQELRGGHNGPHRPGPGPGVHTARTYDGLDISYRIVGDGWRDIVLVHGWGVSGGVYDFLVTELQSQGYRLIIPDLRGTGGSSKPASGYTIENYARDVLAVTRDARAGRFVLVGHSMGGAIAQKVAAMRPGRIEGLVLMSPVPASGFPLPPAYYQLFEASANDPGLKAFIFNISSVALEPIELNTLMASASTVSPTAVVDSLAAWTGADFADELHKIRAETLVLVSDDPFMNPTMLQQAVADPIGSNASVQYFGGAGHYVQVEKAAQTASTINAFIDGLPCRPFWRPACH